MEVIGPIIIISMLIAAYAAPVFVFALLLVLAYAVIAKRYKSLREEIKRAARLTPLLTVVFFVALHGLIYVSKPQPKNLDGVSPDNFRLSSYYVGSPSLQKALEKIFPLGTSKDQIDKVLVEGGGAKMDEGTNFARGITGARYKRRAWPWTFFPMGGTPVVSVYAEYDVQLKLTFLQARQFPNGCSYF